MTAIRVELELDSGQFTSRMIHAGETVAQFNRNVGQGYTSITRMNESSQSFLGTLRDVTIVLGLAREALRAVNSVTTGIVGDIVKVNAEFERTTVLLKGMGQGANAAKEAADQVKYLRDFAKQAPFELKAITDTFVKMKSAGIDPMKGALKSVVDSVAAFGGDEQSLHRVTIALQQMSGKGVIQMEELRQQLGEHIPRAVELMARSVGVTTGELIQKISKGTVEAKTTLAAFMSELDRTFGGSAQAQMQTFNGMVSQMRTQFQNLALDAGEGGFFDAVKQQLKDFNTFLNSDTAKRMAQGFGQGLTTAVNALRSVIDWVIRFRNELYVAGQVLAVTFGARMALGGLASLGSMLKGLSTEFTAFRLSWLNTARAIDTYRTAAAASAAASAAAGAGMGATATGARGVATALGVARIAVLGFGTAIATATTVALPLVGAVVAVAAAFGLFSNRSKDAYENLQKFGAESRKQIQEASGYVKQLEAKVADANRNVEYMMRFNPKTVGAASRDEQRKYWEDKYGVTELNDTIRQVKDTLSKADVDFSKREADRLVRDRIDALDDQRMSLQKTYDLQAKDAAKAHDDEIKRLSNEHRDVTREQQSYLKTQRDMALKFYDDQYQLLEDELNRSRIAKDLGDKDELLRADKLQGELLQRQRAVKEQRDALAAAPIGIQEIVKPTDVQKTLDRAQNMLNSLNGKIAEHKAELAGVSGEYAKLAYQLEQAQGKKAFSAENDQVAEYIAKLKAAQVELDKLTEATSGQNKLNSDLEGELNKQLEKNVELRTKGKSALDAILVKLEMGVYSGKKPTALLAQNFDQIDSAARRASEGIGEAFGPGLIDRGRMMLDIVNGVATGFDRVSTTSRVAGKPQQSGAVAYPTYTAGSTYTQNLMKRESSMNPNAKASGSSAEGLGQFIESTWMQFLKEMHPEFTNASKEAALNLRRDPKYMEEAIGWYASKNAAELDKARVSVNDANLYLAHFLGPSGAVAALTKSNDTLLNAIPALDAARKSNPGVFKDMLTVGDLKSWSQSFMGSGFTAPTYKGAPSGDNLSRLMSGLDPKQQELVQQIMRVTSSNDLLKNKGAITDWAKDAVLEIQKLKDADGELGKETNVAKLMKAIRQGKFGDRNPQAEQYQELIKLAKEWDQTAQVAAEHEKLRAKTKNFENSKEGLEAGLKSREDELAQRVADESAFKFSTAYNRVFKDLTSKKIDFERAIAAGIDPEKNKANIATIDNMLKRERDLEIGNTIKTEQDKNNEIARSLMTQDQAREDTYQKEVKRLQNLLALTSLDADQRAELEKIVQTKIQLLRKQTDEASPVGRLMKSWGDVGQNLQGSMSNWLTSTTDKIADFVTTGKAQFSDLAASIAKDMISISLRGGISQMFGSTITGGAGKLSGGAGKMSGGTSKLAAAHHNGGIAGSVRPTRSIDPLTFLNAPRFHGGGFPGLTAGEVPIIAKKGEEVGWPDQLAKKYGGATVGQTNHFNITVNGSAGTQAQNEDLAAQITKQMQGAAKSMVTEELSRQLRPGGLISSGRRR